MLGLTISTELIEFWNLVTILRIAKAFRPTSSSSPKFNVCENSDKSRPDVNPFPLPLSTTARQSLSSWSCWKHFSNSLFFGRIWLFKLIFLSLNSRLIPEKCGVHSVTLFWTIHFDMIDKLARTWDFECLKLVVTRVICR